MKTRSNNALLWFGILGGPLGWAAQFVASYWFALAQCDPPVPRWRLPLHAWEIGLACGGLVVGAVATVVSLRILLRSYRVDTDVLQEELRGIGSEPPLGRVMFLAVIGLTVNLLAIPIVIITGVGAPVLTVCQQS
jgi:hypothetical protein